MILSLCMLKYQPKPGSIVRCNFDGFIAPEIIKNRPVLVIHLHKTNSKLVTVIPISTTTPITIERYHHRLDTSFEIGVQQFLPNTKGWFKCDLIYVVSIERMDRLKNKKNGEWGIPHISTDTLLKIKEMVRDANGL